MGSFSYAWEEDEAAEHELILRKAAAHHESPDMPPAVMPNDLMTRPCPTVKSDDALMSTLVQVNVDASGNNIPNDAGNEPSLAIDPTNPSNMVIGWRQFDSVSSNFRQAGWGYSTNGGATWTFAGKINAGVFRSDPVLDTDSTGVFYYNSLNGNNFLCDVYKSSNGGVTWGNPNPAYGGDKQWMVIDKTTGIGQDNIYIYWSSAAGCCGLNVFTRSTDLGLTYSNPQSLPTDMIWGTLAVAPNGKLYLIGSDFNGPHCVRSSNAQDPAQSVVFDASTVVTLGGDITTGTPNGSGLCGQLQIAVDYSSGPTAGWVYALASVDPPGADPLDVHISHSTDQGLTWSAPVRVNDDPTTAEYQWFGTFAVAPNGRIDVAWNDTRNGANVNQCQLFYSYSTDGGVTFAANSVESPLWTSNIGYPQQDKIGDYSGMISDNGGANLAFAATFNGEQDVWFTRIPAPGGCPTITVSPASLPNGTVGTPYSQTITASGGTAPYTFAVTAGALPNGLTLTAGGVLSGTPSATGTFNFTVTATDSAACTGSRAYTIVISSGCGVITLSPATLPGGTVGIPYSQTITASGGTAPYTFAVTAGTVPTGLSLSAGGVLSGTPTTPGTFNFTVTATDNAGCTGSQAYSVVVSPQGCGTITLAPATLPSGTVGTGYSQTITASGGTAPYTFAVTAGTLPAGLALASGGVLSGVPSAVGTYNFTVTATDAATCSGSRAYTITIGQLVDFVVGQGLGDPNPNEVKVYTGAGAATTVDFLAYAAGRWGVNVAAGDVNGPLYEEIITGPGPGDVYGPQVRAFDRAGTPINGINFYAYGTLRYGVNVASGDLDGDPFAEILTGAGPGAVFGPHVRGWNYDGGPLTPISKVSFFAYSTLKYGVNVADAKLDGDVYGEILTGPGPGLIFAPTVRGWNYDNATVTSIGKINFNAFVTLSMGVNVAGGDFDADGYWEIAATPGPGAGPSYPSRFLGFNYDDSTIAGLPGFDVTPYATTYGGRVGAGDVSLDGREDLLTGAGRDPAASSQVRAYAYITSSLNVLPGTFLPFTTSYGVNVAGALLGY
ncbi:MAG: putative Ig domain-containing protein [Acidobacteriota bacterium]